MRILAIASGGGHWEQMMLLRAAFEGAEVMYITTLPGLPERSGVTSFAYVPECNRNDVVKIIHNMVATVRVILQFRPDVVVSTGALPGLIGLAIAKFLFRRRTVWIDSIANSAELSLSGRIARRVSDLWVTQWPEVAAATGAAYLGRVI